MQKITPCLWFDDQAEQAAEFYTSVFANSRIVSVSRHTGSTAAKTGRPAGSVLMVVFELEGQRFTSLNGGPIFKFSPAISIMVSCKTQAEIDALWSKLSAVPEAEACGWVKDKYGVSWQIVPATIEGMMSDRNPKRVDAVMAAILTMKKLDMEALEKAYASAT